MNEFHIHVCQILSVRSMFCKLRTFLDLFLLQHGDIQRNPGPQSGHIKNISCYHWNTNSLVAQSLSKITQIEAYHSLYKHELICISKKYFDSSILEGDSSFQLDEYKVIRAYHLSNTKRGGACIYYKELLSVRALNVTNLSECIICEVSIQNCKGQLVLFIDLQAKILPKLKNSCQTSRTFLILLHRPALYLL